MRYFSTHYSITSVFLEVSINGFYSRQTIRGNEILKGEFGLRQNRFGT